MRKFYTLLLVLCSWNFATQAQITISPDEFPVAGLKVGKAYTTAASSILGLPGGPQLYDLTQIIPLYHDSVHWYDAAQTLWGSQHPGATLCLPEPSDGMTWVWYYKTTATTLEKCGLTVIGDFGQGLDTVHGNYTINDTTLSTDYSLGHHETEFSTVTIPNLVPFADYKINTFRIIDVDAWGSMQTPLNTYDNVLRVKYKEYRYDTLSYFSTPVYIVGDTTYYYKYYAEDERYPVMTAYTDSLYNLSFFEFIFTPPQIVGCTDPMAQNYNPLANVSDGSCTYCSVSYSISSDTLVCPGSPVTLTVTGGNSWLWEDGSTSSSVTVSPAHSTVYSVYVSNSPQCHDLASVSVNVDEPVTAGFWTTHSSYILYEDIQFVNTSLNAGSYSWDLDEGVSGLTNLEHPLFAYSVSGEKDVVLIASNTCYADTAYDTIYIIIPSGLESADDAAEFRIWPNPGKDNIIIEAYLPKDEMVEVNVYDGLGRRVHRESAEGTAGAIQLSLSVADLLPALYIVELRTQESVSKVKWIKSN